jgi:hypothetical protein
MKKNKGSMGGINGWKRQNNGNQWKWTWGLDLKLENFLKFG